MDVRKWILVLASSFLFASLANAQGGVTCAAVGVLPPQLRSEGLTELVGDIVLVCSGGIPPALGAEIPTATITVLLNGPVTSRLLNTGGISGASEALLLVDDPGNGGGTYGSSVPQTYCGNPSLGAGPGGCTEYLGYSNLAGGSPAGGVPVASNPDTGPGGTFSATPLAPGANIFQGIVSGNTVTFNNIPVMPSTDANASHILRITNIRVNADAITGGGSTQVNAVATVSATGIFVTFPPGGPSLPVGYASPSLSTSLTKAYSTSSSGLAGSIALSQCQSYPSNGSTPVALETLVFKELTGSAFRPRGSTAQNSPGTRYDTESGLTVSAVTGSGGLVSGYADWGTRLKAVFHNIPAGVSIYVSTTNLNSSYNAPMGTVAAAGSLAGSSFAQLITSETSSDSGPSAALANNFTPWAPVVSQTGTATSSVTGGMAASPIGYAPLTIVGGSAAAVWEVENSVANTAETLAFEVLILRTSDTGVPGTMTVNMSYAPIPTQGAFTALAGGAASSSLGAPRYTDSSTSLTAATVVTCGVNSVPALSPWAMAVLAILLLAIVAQVTRKRRLEN